MAIAATANTGYTGALALPAAGAISVGPQAGRTGTGDPLTIVFEVIPIVGSQ